MSADFRDTAHLVTGTLDTSGYGEGDLRDVALVYKHQHPAPEAEPAPEPGAPADDNLTPEPLFTPDGEPTAQATPSPRPPKIGEQVLDTETGIVSEFDGTDWVKLSPEPDQEPQPGTEPASAAVEITPVEAPPVDQTARAGKESKPPAGAATKTTRRGKAAG